MHLCLPRSDPACAGRGINISLEGLQRTNFPVLSIEEKKNRTLSEKLVVSGPAEILLPPAPTGVLTVVVIRAEIPPLLWRGAVQV